jgi:hypothetical protein
MGEMMFEGLRVFALVSTARPVATERMATKWPPAIIPRPSAEMVFEIDEVVHNLQSIKNGVDGMTTILKGAQ